MEDFDVNYIQIGTLASLTALTCGVTLLLVGNYVDTRGPKIGIVVGLFIAGIGQLIFTFAPNYGMLLVARALMGIGIGLLFLAPYTMVTRWFERSKKVASALGVMGATEGIGTFVALYLLASIFTSAGYYGGNIVAGIAITALGFITLVFLKEPPHLQRGKLLAPQEGVFKRYLKVLSHRNVIATSFVLIGLWGAYTTILFWVPTLLMEEGDWSADRAGLIAALYPLVGVISAIASGSLSDKLRNRKTLLVVSGLGLALSSAGFTIALMLDDYTFVAVLLPLAGIFHYASLPLAFATAFDSVGVQLSGIANGVLFGIGSLVGGIVFPLALGAIRDATGSYNVGFIVLGVAVLVLNFLVPIILLRGTTQKEITPLDSETLSSNSIN